MNPSNNTVVDSTPFIPANQSLPELTLKAIILSVILVILLAAANAYLGLKIGITVSASIPAAVISMGVLRLFRNSNILENNIVQTAASAGEAIVSGISFVLPAMIIVHYWNHFNYWETLLISLIGGTLGVFFSIPLRRVLLPHKELRFPEGTAIGQVLKASAAGKANLKYLVNGSLVGGLISLCQAGFQVISGTVEYWQTWGNRFVYGTTIGFDPALMAAGYIVGPSVAASTLLGVFLGWIIGVPLLTFHYGITNTDPSLAAMDVWKAHIRYIGVGTMLVGGFWTLITLLKPIADGLRASLGSVKALKMAGHASIPRTERDIPINYIGWAMLLLCIPMGFLLYHYVNDPILPFSMGLKITTVVIGILFMVFGGFLFSALGGYFAGLFGSTNSPTSALSLATLFLMSLLLLGLWGPHIDFTTHSKETLAAIAFVLVISSVLGAGSITNETIQDLKAGQIVGATPWKQQVMLLIGVVISAFLVPWVLELLYQAYGIGGVFPRPGMDHARMLAAPQAGMMAALAQGAFSYNLPLAMMSIGGAIAVIAIVADRILRQHGSSMSVLAVGFGIYLPLDATLPFIFGGIAAYIINRALTKKYPNESEKPIVVENQQRGLTLACGIVAGAALMGVILAIPFAIKESTDALKIVPDSFTHISDMLAPVVGLLLLGWIYYTVVKKKISD